MRAQAIFWRSRSSLKASKTFCLPRPNHSSLPYNGKRLTSSSASNFEVAPSTLDSAVEPEAGPILSASPSSPPTEEPERTKTRRTRPFTSITPKEPELPELPEALDILWTPASGGTQEPFELHSLPPEDILEEALHNLHVALHPQTQNHAVFASPLGPPIEPSLGLYCPIEGGEYVIDATVKELATRTGAEVLILDSVQLAAGEWGDFGPGMNSVNIDLLACLKCTEAAMSLQLPRNPLHFSSSSLPPSARPPLTPPPDEDDEHTSPFPSLPLLTFMAPAGSSSPSVLASSSKRAVPASKVKVFFDALVNMKPKDPELQSTSTGKPRLVYIRDFPTLASTSSTWYPHLLSSIRQRRKGAMSRSSSPVPNPMAIIYGITPPLLAQTPPEGNGGSGFLNLLMNKQSHQSALPNSLKATKSEWGENQTADSAREKRLRQRLRKWEKGENVLQSEYPRLYPLDETSESSSRPEVIVVGSGTSTLATLTRTLSGRSTPESESRPSFFRNSVLVPRLRSPTQEQASRVSRRREINELTMRMGIGAVGGVLQPERADLVFQRNVEAEHVQEAVDSDTEANPNTNPTTEIEQPENEMWDKWGNRIEMWSNVRRIADRALGSVIAASAEERKPTLDRTFVPWHVVSRAWASVNGVLDVRRSWLKEALPSVLAADNEEGERVGKGYHDEVIEAVKNDPDLDHHEQRLLSSIVDAASMSTTFSQVHLPQHTIDSVRSIVSLPLLHPKAFQHGILKEHGMTGCLLFGPPGTGKTLVVRALAKEAGCRMMVVSPSDVMDMYVGEGEKLVRAVFSLARKLSPCVIFLDEIDALFGARMSARESGSAIAHRGVITEFMQEMDGLKSSKEDNVIVIGATNRPFDLDDAVLRRLPRRLLVDLPGEKERAEILKILLRDETLHSDVNISALAKQTDSFSGSDLKHLCVSAALDAVKERVRLPWSPESNSEEIHTYIEDMDSNVNQQDDVAGIPKESVQSEKPEKTRQRSSRVLSKQNFNKALKEITPSSSEALGSLAELRKWNEEFGEGRRDRKRILIWGKGLFGFNDQGSFPKQDDIRISSPVSDS
ncbi:hypothetical protein E1B28_008693 [Marasmius oreades]|uniref:AAA+ ATPase domain-containing protein n=1 Tax=Marasmius oreades TaxID=181124 RepID=A0A9P7RZJ8_9AGAR|nr:uncharacterized protein E1B28_008693 [Marasmius oreades]KAG7092332.1 hypothetical protein E1B28_008693 [Marasmius oreades]